MSDANSFSRRDALKEFVLLCGAAGALAAAVRRRRPTYRICRPTDPTAKALGYTQDAKTVDMKKFPTYAAGQMCSTCLQFQGKPAMPMAPCNIFAGKLVNANGWCRSGSRRPERPRPPPSGGRVCAVSRSA